VDDDPEVAGAELTVSRARSARLARQQHATSVSLLVVDGGNDEVPAMDASARRCAASGALPGAARNLQPPKSEPGMLAGIQIRASQRGDTTLCVRRHDPVRAAARPCTQGSTSAPGAVSGSFVPMAIILDPCDFFGSLPTNLFLLSKSSKPRVELDKENSLNSSLNSSSCISRRRRACRESQWFR
jgi:hypothetical protein